jgi:hypothetical protein
VGKSVSESIGTIIVSIALAVVPQILMVKEMVTQTNANFWLIGSVVYSS